MSLDSLFSPYYPEVSLSLFFFLTLILVQNGGTPRGVGGLLLLCATAGIGGTILAICRYLMFWRKKGKLSTKMTPFFQGGSRFNQRTFFLSQTSRGLSQTGSQLYGTELGGWKKKNPVDLRHPNIPWRNSMGNWTWSHTWKSANLCHSFLTVPSSGL